jgi:hypothetical protein
MDEKSQMTQLLLDGNVKNTMKKSEQAMREKVAKAMKDDIVIKLQVRYVKYYKHWKDYDLLTCILAVIGLVLAVVEVGNHF